MAERNGNQAQPGTSESSSGLRQCFRTPVPEIALAARLLDDAVTAHLLGHASIAEQLIRMANLREISDWTDSIWGKASPYVRYRKVADGPSILNSKQRVKSRMPSQADRRILLQRYGYHCLFCDIPLIRSEIRKLLKRFYPSALLWGDTNATQHAAFQAMWVQYDHVIPHARGGDNNLDNFVITCAACNFGRMEKTLAEVGLEDPRKREPFRSDWDGLERLLSVEAR